MHLNSVSFYVNECVVDACWLLVISVVSAEKHLEIVELFAISIITFL